MRKTPILFLSVLLILAMLLGGCHATGDAIAEEPETSDVVSEASTGEIAEETLSPITVEFVRCYDDAAHEYAVVTATGEDGVLWTFTTDLYDMTELDRTSDIGAWNDRYYLSAGGTILALDLESGKILWANDGFGGCPAGDDASIIGEDGTIYICGYYGPNLFIVDSEGETKYQLSDEGDHYWAYKLELMEGGVNIYCAGGPQGDTGEAYIVTVGIMEGAEECITTN